MKIISDLSITSAPHRARHGWHPGWLFRSGAQGAWFDPSDPTTQFQDPAGTIPVASDGDPVALMLDKSGNGNHASQHVVAARPTWRSDGNLAWLEFDGVDDQFRLPPIPYSNPMTVCLGLHRFPSGTWSAFRSPLVIPPFVNAGSSHPTDTGTITNNAGGTTRVDGVPFTGTRIDLYNALQQPRVGTAPDNTANALQLEGTFFSYGPHRPSGRVFAYVEAEGHEAVALPFLERWMAGKTGVAL